MLISSKRKEKEKNAVSPYVHRKEKKKEEWKKKQKTLCPRAFRNIWRHKRSTGEGLALNEDVTLKIFDVKSFFYVEHKE